MFCTMVRLTSVDVNVILKDKKSFQELLHHLLPVMGNERSVVGSDLSSRDCLLLCNSVVSLLPPGAVLAGDKGLIFVRIVRYSW